MGQKNKANKKHTFTLPQDAELDLAFAFIEDYDQEAYQILEALWKKSRTEPFPATDPNTAELKDLVSLKSFISNLNIQYLDSAKIEDIYLYNDGTDKGLAFGISDGFLDVYALGIVDVMCGLKKRERNPDIDVIWKIFIHVALYMYTHDMTMYYLESEIELIEESESFINLDEDQVEYHKEVTDLQARYPVVDKKVKKLLVELYIKKYQKVEIKKHYKSPKTQKLVDYYHDWLKLSATYRASIDTLINNNNDGYFSPIEYTLTCCGENTLCELLEKHVNYSYEVNGGMSYNRYKLLLEDERVLDMDPGKPIEALQFLIQELRNYEYKHKNTNLDRIEKVIESWYKTPKAKKLSCLIHRVV